MQHRHNTPYFLVPNGNSTRLCRMESGNVEQVASLPYSIEAEIFIFGENWIAVIVKNGRRVVVDKIEDNKVNRHAAFDAPSKGKYSCVMMIGNIIYIGGSSGVESLWMADISVDGAELKPLSIPKKVMKYGKAIDDFILDDSRLIAVDNIVFPKWFIEYDITKPAKPKRLSVKSIYNNYTYERVKRAISAGDVCCVFSQGVGRGGVKQFISLYTQQSLDTIGSIHQEFDWRFSIEMGCSKIDPELKWQTIDFADGHLVVTLSKGFAVIPLRTLSRKRVKPFFNPLKKTGIIRGSYTLASDISVINYQSIIQTIPLGPDLLLIGDVEPIKENNSDSGKNYAWEMISEYRQKANKYIGYRFIKPQPSPELSQSRKDEIMQAIKNYRSLK